MKQIVINCCAECPYFVEPAFHSDVLGSYSFCFLEKEENGWQEHNEITDSGVTPDWCPLLKEGYQITHKDKKADSENS